MTNYGVKMFKKAHLLAAATMVIMTSVFSEMPKTERGFWGASIAHAAAAWSFCSTTGQSSCIEKVVVMDISGRQTEYVSTATLKNDNVLIDVGCLGPSGQCLGGPSSSEILKANADSCADLSSTIYFPLYINASVLGHRDYEVEIQLQMGTNEPGLSVGSGIVGTEISQDQSGMWRYTVRTKAVVRTGANLPMNLQGRIPDNSYKAEYSQFIANATADFAFAGATVSLFAPKLLRWEVSAYNPSGGHGYSWITKKMCDYVPLNGAWMSANANGFEFGLMAQATKNDVPWYFKFAASAPHYIYSQMLDTQPGAYNSGPFQGEKIMNPAEIKMWLPRAYGTKLGYSTAVEMQAGMTVNTEDGQAAAPSVKEANGGFLVNLGINHYSVPNPAVLFTPGASYVNPFAEVAAPAFATIKIARSRTLTSLLSIVGLSLNKGSKVSALVSNSSKKNCKISSNKVVAIKQGKCRVSLTVKPKSGKSANKTLTLEIIK
jgi:hypothetical protein